MISEIIRLHVSNHNGLTVGEVAEDIFVSYDTCATLLHKMEKRGLISSDKKRGRRYTCEKHGVTSQVMDEYVHRVIAKESEKMTIDDVMSITYLTRYTVSRSLTRLKNLGKISTMTGHGITLLIQPSASLRTPWKSSDIKYLKENLGVKSVSEICRNLNRTSRSIHIKASQLGMSTVTRKCRHGHEMIHRPTGKWVCNECHAKREREKRNE